MANGKTIAAARAWTLRRQGDGHAIAASGEQHGGPHHRGGLRGLLASFVAPASSASPATSSSPPTGSGWCARSAPPRWWLTSLAVVIGAIGVALGFQLADPLVGLAITVTILFVLKGAARDIYRRLMDSVDPDLVDQVGGVLAAVPGVEGSGERASALGRARAAAPLATVGHIASAGHNREQRVLCGAEDYVSTAAAAVRCCCSGDWRAG